jgi:uncharacterized protein
MEPQPVRVRLRVSPGARRPEVVGRYGDGWKVRVTQQPEQGRANDAVVALLADTLGVHKSSVHVVSGRASRDKVVELAGITRSDAERRLHAGGRT